MNIWGAAIGAVQWSWQGSLTQNRQTQSQCSTVQPVVGQSVLSISLKTQPQATVIVDRPYPTMLSGVLFVQSELIFLCLSLSYIHSDFLFHFFISFSFSVNLINLPPSLICSLRFLLVWVWLCVPGRDYHSWDCPLCSRAPLFHFLASLPLSAFRGGLFSTRESRESPPCVSNPRESFYLGDCSFDRRGKSDTSMA